MFMNKDNLDEVEAYIFPTYGNGLWNNIWGFIALKPDLRTIKGAAFDHVGETPGLGARITSPDIQSRYRDKQIFDEQGNLVSVEMVKGEKGDNSIYGPHQVDGLSGATLTAKGVNEMLSSYFGYYQSYIDKLKAGEGNITMNQTL
jgi:Na+-transporting NADH:ubiquinone oxidoreductase subunit C